MNRILLAAVVAFAGYSAWSDYRHLLFPMKPLYAKPYIVLYGRESCGNCQALRRDLDGGGVPYHWKIIDEDPGRSEAFARMQAAGLGIGSFTLPVVDVNAEMLIHPETSVVLAKYRRR